MRLEYKLLIGFGIIAVLALIGGGVFVAKQFSSGNGVELSGKIVELEDNPMAEAPCHYMANQWMGDCVVREVHLEAWNWDWSEPVITVRSGELVRIVATSKDVKHGFAIPAIKFNMEIEPGKITVGEFMAPEAGEYPYGCSVFCGDGHHEHTGKLVVLE